MTPDEQAYFDEQLKNLRERMTGTQFDLIWSKGSGMSIEQAIEFALSS
jgi:hypothetical protein